MFNLVAHDHYERVPHYRDAFAAARDAKRPTLIAAHVDPSAYKLA